MGKSGSVKIRRFLASMDWGLCEGPITSFNRIRYKGKTLWNGPDNGQQVFEITDKKTLFGGDTEGEGGWYGAVEFFLGGTSQLATQELADRYGTTVATESGQPGLAHVFFRGFGGKGAQWQCNNPYFGTDLDIAATNVESGLAGEARIWPIIGVDEFGEYILATSLDVYDDGGVYQPQNAPDKNPAHIVWDELILAGYSESDLVESTFTDAAALFRDENFGLTVKVVDDIMPETVIQEVLDHVRAALVKDMATGTLSLVPFRFDYDVNSLVTFDKSNCELISYKVTAYSEMANKVVVEYIDPETEDTATVDVTLDGSKPQEEEVRPETVEYHFIRNPWLAAKIASRDLHEMSLPLAGAVISIDRENAAIAEGEVVNLYLPHKKIESKPFRVMKIQQSKSDEGKLQLTLAEDFLSRTEPSVVIDTQQYDGTVPSETTPEYIGLSVPYALAKLDPEFEDTYSVTMASIDEDYPVATTAFTVAYKAGSVYAAIGSAPNARGQVADRIVAAVPGVRAYELVEALPEEATSTVPLDMIRFLGGADVTVGTPFIVGAAEELHEIIVLDSYDPVEQRWTVLRGCFDTVPEEWGVGSQVFRLSGSLDSQLRTPGSTVTYYFDDNLLTYESLDDEVQWDVDENGVSVVGLPFIQVVPDERIHRPYRPADVKIDGVGFGINEYGVADPPPSTIGITWANRNRLTEDSVILSWTDASVTPEAGQTTTIQFYDDITDTLEFEVTGLTGTSYSVDMVNLTDYRYYRMEIFSVNTPGTVAPALESFRRVTRYFEVVRAGYGLNYGQDYGGQV